MPEHIVNVKLKNFRGFKNWCAQLEKVNVLVGPNNCGKSTLIWVFRILSEALRRARSKRQTLINTGIETFHGYELNLSNIPMAVENIRYNQLLDELTYVKFTLSNKNELELRFGEDGACFLVCNGGVSVKSVSEFKRQFDVVIGFVPVLGPFDYAEQLYKKETAQDSLMTFGASRNFRNIWFHFSEEFELFRELLKRTWDGVDIEQPSVDMSFEKPRLHMFFIENRMPREIVWAGYGFQIWCQLLTYMIKNRSSSVILIDEPDIYLHGDLQRRLLALISELDIDVVLATHSVEMISEASPSDVIYVDKNSRYGKRLKNRASLEMVFDALGTAIVPVLSLVAKTRRVLFYEGDDHALISLFARVVGKPRLERTDGFAIIKLVGNRPSGVRDILNGIKEAIGKDVKSAVVLDGDYRTISQREETERDLSKICDFSYVHRVKEIENYLLCVDALERSTHRAIHERQTRGFREIPLPDVEKLLRNSIEELRVETLVNWKVELFKEEKRKNPGFSDNTIDEMLIRRFEEIWDDHEKRIDIVPGKRVLSGFRRRLSETSKVSITNRHIAQCLSKGQISREVIQIVNGIDSVLFDDA